MNGSLDVVTILLVLEENSSKELWNTVRIVYMFGYL
jgi:hypothetical protein